MSRYWAAGVLGAAIGALLPVWVFVMVAVYHGTFTHEDVNAALALVIALAPIGGILAAVVQPSEPHP